MSNEKVSVEMTMMWENNRRTTFEGWTHPDPSRMAEAGWYSTEPDSAVCFLCGKTLEGWGENDDPWKEHEDHAPLCAFVQLRKPERDMTLAEFLGLRHQLHLNYLDKMKNKTKEQFKQYVKTVQQN